MKADRIAGGVITIAGLGLMIAVTQVDILDNQPTLSARFFPYVLSVILSVGGLGLMFKPGDAKFSDVINKLLASRGVTFAFVFLVYTLTFRFVDFRFGTWAFLLITMWILGSRKWIELLILPISVSMIIYLLFRYGFTVLLPTWN
jgi:putative tricarboxylic transport membrane protein